MAVLTYNGNIIGKSSANDGVLTIKRNGTTIQEFSANQSNNVIADISIPTKTSDLTNDSGYITSSGNCSNASNNLNSYQIDLRDTSIYNENTWYPVTFLYNGGGSNEFYQIGVRATLGGSGKPSWATHSNGFSCAIDLLVTDSGWGSIPRADMQLRNVFDFVSDGKNPVGYIQLTSSSTQVFYLRGGGNYYITSKSGIRSITVHKESYTKYDQTVAPTTTYPGINLSRTVLDAYINGYIPTSSISATSGVCRHYRYAISAMSISSIQTALEAMYNARSTTYPEFASNPSIIVTFVDSVSGGSASARVSCNGVGYFSALIYSFYFGGEMYLLRYVYGNWEKFKFTGTSF